jgi:enoyl-CoA hydratase/carnithine racemase
MASTKTLMRALPGVGIPLDKPRIAALHGFCVGMGMTLALHCDLRLAAKNTVLGYRGQARHDLRRQRHAPAAGDPQAKALEMMLLGRNMTADEALRIGLINAVVDNVQAEARAWADAIASYSPVAVQATKRLALFPQRLSEAEKAEITAVRELVESKDDFKHGATAFTKRA